MAGAKRPHGARQGRGRLNAAADLWGGTEYDAIVPHYAAIYDELVARLEPLPGERWLDVATGTGEVALRAARAGATVTGLDSSPAMVERARAKAAAEGVAVDFLVGDATHLPFSDGAFDVIASNFGVVFAADAHRTGAELARVARSRIGFTAWHSLPGLTALYARFGRPPVDPQRDLWAEHPGELLGDAFEVEAHERVWHLRGESGRSVLEFWERTAPPTQAYLASLDEDTREAVRTALADHWEGYRDGDHVSEPRPYTLVIGRRRA